MIGVAPEAAEGKATQGTLVAIRFPGDDEVETLSVGIPRGGQAQRRSAGGLPASPLGAALMGSTAGDTVSTLPNGKELTVEVVSVEVYGG